LLGVVEGGLSFVGKEVGEARLVWIVAWSPG